MGRHIFCLQESSMNKEAFWRPSRGSHSERRSATSDAWSVEQASLHWEVCQKTALLQLGRSESDRFRADIGDGRRGGTVSVASLAGGDPTRSASRGRSPASSPVRVGALEKFFFAKHLTIQIFFVYLQRGIRTNTDNGKSCDTYR